MFNNGLVRLGMSPLKNYFDRWEKWSFFDFFFTAQPLTIDRPLKIRQKKLQIASNSSKSVTNLNFLIHRKAYIQIQRTQRAAIYMVLFGVTVSVVRGQRLAPASISEQPLRPLWPASSSSYAWRTSSLYVYQNLSSVPAFTGLRVRDSSMLDI